MFLSIIVFVKDGRKGIAALCIAARKMLWRGCTGGHPAAAGGGQLVSAVGAEADEFEAGAFFCAAVGMARDGDDAVARGGEDGDAMGAQAAHDGVDVC